VWLLRAREVEALLRRFDIVPMVGDAIAVRAASNFRALRRRGITIRPSICLLAPGASKTAGRFCTNDSDVRPMVRHLGLIELAV
jgi:predicted nucleic acid-binding protein